jgi:putative membrane protein
MHHKIVGITAATLLGVFTFSPGWAADESTFLQDAIAGSIAEVQVGQLAQQNGGSADVKAFGQRLVSDHSKAMDQAAALAKTMSVQVPTEPNPEAQDEYQKLQGLKGAEFDKAFAQAMVKDHEETIQKFEQQSKAGNDQVTQYAQQTLPVLQTHLDMAKKIEAQQK